MKELQEKLIFIQAALKAPKGAYNSFGKYKYRSQEDILEALKPLLKDSGVLLTVTDELKEVGKFTFIEATASVSDGESVISVKAQAGVAERKGMDISQCFGSSSSYARKYALGGLFLIDETKDSDSPWLREGSKEFNAVVSAIKEGKRTLEQAREKFMISPEALERVKELTKKGGSV